MMLLENAGGIFVIVRGNLRDKKVPPESESAEKARCKPVPRGGARTKSAMTLGNYPFRLKVSPAAGRENVNRHSVRKTMGVVLRNSAVFNYQTRKTFCTEEFSGLRGQIIETTSLL